MAIDFPSLFQYFKSLLPETPEPNITGPPEMRARERTPSDTFRDLVNEYLPNTEYARQVNAPVGILQDSPGSPLLGAVPFGGKVLSGGVSRDRVRELIKEYKNTPVDIFNPKTGENIFEGVPLHVAKKATNVANEAEPYTRFDYGPRAPKVPGRSDLQDIEDAFAARQPVQPTYFSTLQSTFSDPKLPEKLDAKQVKNFLASRPGVTKDELKWSGLDDLLEQRQGKITKKEILNHLEENNVQVVEVSAGGENKTGPIYHEWRNAHFNRGPQGWEDEAGNIFTDERLHQLFDDQRGLSNTKFATWTQPGGTNYREVKLVWGNPATKKLPAKTYYDDAGFPFAHSESYESKTLFESSHFSEPNILAHFRLKDRMTPDGKKVLFVEEIQSDWHQAARDVERSKEWSKKLADAGFPSTPDIRRDIPSAPFSKTWPELAMKRIMRMASEEGYDAIGWTTGEMQSRMYGKALEEVGHLKYYPKDSDHLLVIYDKKGSIMTSKSVPPEILPEVVGQKNAENLLFSPSSIGSNKDYNLYGPLTIGKEGMSTFYDQVLPQTANKLAKKWGTQVGQKSISLPRAGVGFSNENYHFLPITPTMRESARRAFPLFIGAGAAAGLTLNNLYYENER